MDHIGKEVEITVGAKTYKLSRFTRAVLRDFLAWADKELGHPLDAVKGHLKDLPEKLQELVVKDALAKATVRRSLNSPEVQSLLTTPEGAMKVLSLLFKKYHPELTDNDVDAVYESCVRDHGEGWLEDQIVKAVGVMPPDEGSAEEEYMRLKGLLSDRGLLRQVRPDSGA